MLHSVPRAFPYQFVSKILEIVAAGVLAITRIFRIITTGNPDLPKTFLLFSNVPTVDARERDSVQKTLLKKEHPCLGHRRQLEARLLHLIHV